MLRRWLHGLLVTMIVGVVVTTAVGSAAAPVAAMLPSGTISADLGAVRVALKL
jgi:hypothetical protein